MRLSKGPYSTPSTRKSRIPSGWIVEVSVVGVPDRAMISKLYHLSATGSMGRACFGATAVRNLAWGKIGHIGDKP